MLLQIYKKCLHRGFKFVRDTCVICGGTGLQGRLYPKTIGINQGKVQQKIGYI